MEFLPSGGLRIQTFDFEGDFSQEADGLVVISEPRLVIIGRGRDGFLDELYQFTVS
jgi:hypothetical protein